MSTSSSTCFPRPEERKLVAEKAARKSRPKLRRQFPRANKRDDDLTVAAHADAVNISPPVGLADLGGARQRALEPVGVHAHAAGLLPAPPVCPRDEMLAHPEHGGPRALLLLSGIVAIAPMSGVCGVRRIVSVVIGTRRC